MNDDLKLLKEYAESRNADAFAELAKRHAGLVYGACLRIVGNEHDAEDVSQECLLELARKAGSVERSLPGWLHSTATSRSKDAIRRAAVRRRHEEQAMPKSNDAQEPTWAEVAPHIDSAIDQLPEELRLPIVLHYLQGRSQADVAEELQVSQPTVSRRIDEGVGRLREHMKQAGFVVSAAVLAGFLAENAACAAPAAVLAAVGKMAVVGMSGQTTAGTTGGIGSAMLAFLALKTVTAKIVAACALAVIVVGGFAAARQLRGDRGLESFGDQYLEVQIVKGITRPVMGGGHEIARGEAEILSSYVFTIPAAGGKCKARSTVNGITLEASWSGVSGGREPKPFTLHDLAFYIPTSIPFSETGTVQDVYTRPGTRTELTSELSYVGLVYYLGEDKPSVFLRAKWLHFTMAAKALAKEGKLQEAYELLEKRILDPRHPSEQERAAYAMAEISDNSQEAMAAFLQAAERVKMKLEGDAKAYVLFIMGKRMSNLRRYDDSSRFLRDVLAQNEFPGSKWTWSMRYQIGLNCYLQGQYEEAVKVFTELEDSGTADASQAQSLAVQMTDIFFQLKDWPSVIERAERMLPQLEKMKDPRLLGALDQLGAAYYQSGDAASAIRIYQRYLALHEQVYPKPDVFQSAKRNYIADRLDRLIKQNGTVPPR